MVGYRLVADQQRVGQLAAADRPPVGQSVLGQRQVGRLVTLRLVVRSRCHFHRSDLNRPV